MEYKITNYSLSDSTSPFHRSSSDIAMKSYYIYFKNCENNDFIKDIQKAFNALTKKNSKISFSDYKDFLSPLLGSSVLLRAKEREAPFSARETHKIFLDSIKNFKDFSVVCPLCSSIIDTNKKLASNDHIIPALRGGIILPGNSIAMCISCNSKKNDGNIEDFAFDILGKEGSYLSSKEFIYLKDSLRIYCREIFDLTPEEESCLFDTEYFEENSSPIDDTIKSSKSAKHSHLLAKDILIQRSPSGIRNTLSNLYSRDNKYKWLPEEIVLKIKELPLTYSEIRVVSAFDNIFEEGVTLKEMLTPEWSLELIKAIKDYRENVLSTYEKNSNNPLTAVSNILSDIAVENNLETPALSTLDTFKTSIFFSNYQYWLENEDIELYKKFSPNRVSRKLESNPKPTITHNKIYRIISNEEFLNLLLRFPFFSNSTVKEIEFINKTSKLVKELESVTEIDARRIVSIILELAFEGKDFSYINK